MIADNMEKEITIPHRPRQALKPTSRNLASALGLLVGILAVILCLARGAQKTYWHFTIKAAIVPEQAVEWAWVTFVQMDKAEAFPDTAEMVRRMGGEFIGTNLGQVRAAAWRSSYSYTKDRRCNDRPSKIEISWTESWSDQVLAHCQITDTIHRDELFAFKFGFCARRARVLMEDGQRRGLDDLENLIIGPIYMGRGEREAMLGKFRTEAINYEDAQTHYKFCGKSWVEQHNSILLHYTHDGLRGAFVDSLWDTEGVDAFGFQGHDIFVYFTIIRNNSREHPFWKQRYLIR